ncbi:molybdopterin converting factor subunit 1 [Pseudovibrio exalbescens]|uniref:Molybdopterin synthase sulfur carrier subunit n=1 Tax=Pseudovibrio exalbescens TaxID=197461 RepID=A0A1U7JLC2_9HYPH|nr:molybdopterin converting factor subunit 1 [Pseudovibrio exalbescens]OKL45494.1 molybdopterin synthase sulfur carrier subunit [Pseudovibrio exalbescens]
MKLLYFAWLRERVGTGEETIDLPGGVTTAKDLMLWLSQRDEGYAYAFEDPQLIRVAANQQHVSMEADISGADEVAFFPPMTGG